MPLLRAAAKSWLTFSPPPEPGAGRFTTETTMQLTKSQTEYHDAVDAMLHELTGAIAALQTMREQARGLHLMQPPKHVERELAARCERVTAAIPGAWRTLGAAIAALGKVFIQVADEEEHAHGR